MREAGIDSPRINHARVFKNGQLLGVYQNIESEDKEFLEDHYVADGGGNLYESGNELKTNEALNDKSRLTALEALVDGEPIDGDHTRFFSQLDALIDVSQFLREMAAETALSTTDNFSNGSSNFAYYDHPKRGFMVLPWDFDSIVTQAPAGSDLYQFLGVSDVPNKLRQLMNLNPAWKREFDDQLVQIRDAVLPRLGAKVDAICTQIAPALANDPSYVHDQAALWADCAKVKDAVAARAAFITTTLGR
jgi:spore coat protein CotH